MQHSDFKWVGQMNEESKVERIRTICRNAVKRCEEDMENPLNQKVEEYLTGKKNAYLTVLKIITELDIHDDNELARMT